MSLKYIVLGVTAAVLLAACGGRDDGADAPVSEANVPELPHVRTVTIPADERFVEHLQTALITADEGDKIQLPEGTFNLTDGLSLDVNRVTLAGVGQGKTVLSFAGQEGAGEGLLVTSDDVTLTDFTMQDTAGDGIKSKGADRITYTDLTVEWTGGPLATNGAYGVYPVESADVLVDAVTVRGASDAGIYVGQSRNIIVRNSLVEYNVAGIEIENSIGADVHDNVAENNTGGVLVFDLPDLPMVGGHSTRIFNNRIVNNNTDNFAPPGNIVASVPSGSGVMVLANENVHIFDNELSNNRTAHVLLAAYQDEFEDARYNPLPRNVVVRDNSYEGGGDDPQGALAGLAALVGGALPPIVWDGVIRWGETPDQEVNLVLNEDEDIGFVSLGFGTYPIDPAAIAPSIERPEGTVLDEPLPIVIAHDTAG
ncbi:MAG: parallel beta-helix domain-containing protein [Hyphomonadaceae bacterium]